MLQNIYIVVFNLILKTSQNAVIYSNTLTLYKFTHMYIIKLLYIHFLYILVPSILKVGNSHIIIFKYWILTFILNTKFLNAIYTKFRFIYPLVKVI